MSAHVPSDQPVRDAAMRELGTSFFLQAGAGTGKTAVLVGRVVEAVCTGKAELREIVAITFTEKAAGELRDRIRRALYEALTGADQAEAPRLRRALNQVDSAAIQTIHAFASSLLRERPLEAGLDPNFSVLDQVSEQLAFDEVWEEWLWTEEDPRVRPRIERCLRLGLTLDHLRRLTHEISESRDLDPCQPATAPEPPGPFYAWVRRDTQRLVALAEGVTPAVLARVELFRDQVEALADLPEATLEATLSTLAVPRPRLGRSASEARIAFQDALDTLGERLDAYGDAVRAHALAHFIDVASAFVQDAARRRKTAGTLTFSDLLIEARDLILHSARVRRYYRQRYRFLLIDEFQDTDPLQAEIVLLLAADNDATAWRQARPAPGRLFIVGDPKQSIYRFRRADIDIYAEVQDLFQREAARRPGAARVEALSVNFRSRPALVDWYNSVFQTLIQRAPDFPHAQPEYHALHPFREDTGFGVIHLLPNTGVTWKRVGEARQEEAQALVRFIETVVHTEEFALALPHAEARGGTRPPRYRDICVLVRDRTGLEIYSDALAQANIPYHLDSGRGFFLHQEIRDAAALLTVLDDPSDEVALVATLKSAPFAASDAELLEFRRAGGAFRLEAKAIPDGYHGPLRPPLQDLLALRAEMARLSLPAFVDRALRQTHLLDIQLALKNPQRAANLHVIVQRAADFAANDVDSLRPFVRWLSTQTRTDLAEAEAPVTEVEEDVVRILTIHQAKGLEFPIVILAKLARATASDRAVSVVNRDAGTLDFQIGPAAARFQTPGFAAARERQARYEAAEERRLLYVAATRARDYLVIPAFFSDTAYGYHADLEEALPGWTNPEFAVTAPGAIACRVEQLVRAPHVVPRPPTPDVPPLIGAWEAAQQTARRGGAARTVFRAPSAQAHDWLKIPRETAPHEQTLSDRASAATGPDEAAPEAGLSSAPLLAGANGRERGALLHDALATADLANAQAAAHRANALAQERGRPDLGAEISAAVRRTLGSAFFDRVRAARRVERELPLVIHQAGDPAVITEGYVDLAFEEADGWVVVDYKSDAAPSPDTIRGYQEQVRAYARALEAAGGRVREAYVFWTARAQAEPVPLTTADGNP